LISFKALFFSQKILDNGIIGEYNIANKSFDWEKYRGKVFKESGDAEMP